MSGHVKEQNRRLNVMSLQKKQSFVQKHSPLPWNSFNNGIEGPAGPVYKHFAYKGIERNTDIKFIVHACNSFYKMRKLLKDMCRLLTDDKSIDKDVFSKELKETLKVVNG